MSHFTVFNRDDGFVEAFVRGLRSTFLTDMEYANLKEGGSRGGDKVREDFEDLRLTLQETDYGNFLAQEVRRPEWLFFCRGVCCVTLQMGNSTASCCGCRCCC